ncbi:MAG: 4-hydroxybenzoyl-CoA thioesterase [Gammaproteobacteria bacterium]|nr:MAG: 4-hydroxybenzoyl-CoA thioesterase [Gammaproteobacteria bacterium]
MTRYFRLPIRVYIEDTDASGIVFHANYLKFMERARAEMIRACGYEMRSSLQHNINFVVSRLSINYKSPAYVDDSIVSSVRISRLGKSKVVFDQRIVRLADGHFGWENAAVEDIKSEQIELVEAEVVVACVSLATGKPVKMPNEMRDALLNNSSC